MTVYIWTGGLTVSVALVLLALAITGVVRGTPEHPLATAPAKHKNGIVSLSYEESLAALATIEEKLPAAERLSKITSVFASRVRHYWPAPGTTDERVMHDWQENWYLAARQRFEAAYLPGRSGEAGITRIERREYYGILQKGVGLCSQVSLGVASYLAEHGLPGRIVPLGGHVVASTSIDGRNYILDADYNVTFEVPDSKPPAWEAAARSAYARAGYTGRRFEKVIGIFRQTTAEAPIDAWRYGGSWRRTLMWAQTIKWSVPLALLLLGVGLLVRARR